MEITKRYLSLLISVFMLLGIFGIVPIETSASDGNQYEYAMFPMEYLNISQGVNGSFSHQGTNAIDITGKDSGIDSAYAPFTGVVKRIYQNYVVWLESVNPVVYADGTIDYMTVMVMHDNDTSDLSVGMTINQGERFFEEGTAGYATGNHIHLECGKGKYTGTGWYENSYGHWVINNGVLPYDALSLSNNTIIKNDYGYEWRYATNPVGAWDDAIGGPGNIRVTGWVYDMDEPNTSLELHMYVGGPAGSGASCYPLTADVYRDNTSNVGNGKHGFDQYVNVQEVGTQEVYLYALNVGNGSNVCLGQKTVTISGNNPQGVVDHIVGKAGSVYVDGWAFDKDNVSKSLDIHIYLGGPAGSADAEKHTFTANLESTDVNNEYKISGNHRFLAWFVTSKTGKQPIYIYAINTGSGSNVCIKQSEVWISALDFPKDNAKISDTTFLFQGWVLKDKAIDKVQCVINGETVVDAGLYVREDLEAETIAFTKNISTCLLAKYENEIKLRVVYKDGTTENLKTMKVNNIRSVQGHNYTSRVTKAPTCTQTGTTTYTCSVCNNKYTESIPATGHKWQEASCTTKKTCSTCGATEGTVFGHNYTSEISKGATCTQSGIKTFCCTLCSDKYTEEIPSKGHTPAEEWITVSTSETGVITQVKYCLDCDEIAETREFTEETTPSENVTDPSEPADHETEPTLPSDFEEEPTEPAATTPPVQITKTGFLKIGVEGGTGFTISVNGGNARPQGASYRNSKIEIGATVTVVARETANANFVGWMNPATGMILSSDYSYTFTASGNDTINAVFSTIIEGVQVVTFKNDKANRILDSQYYAAEDAIQFPDAPTQVGFDFAGWSMTEEEIKSAIANGQDVEVVANWTRAIVPVKVTVNGGTGSGTYNANSAVTAVANEAPAGQKFAYWTDSKGNIKSYSAEYKFFPSVDTEVTAVFVAEDAVIDYQILVDVDSIDTVTVEGKNVFYFSWYCPEEFTFVKSGILAVNKDNYNESTFVAGTSDSNVYDRSPSGTNKAVNSTSWTKSNVTSGQTWIAKAYVQYRDAQGNIITVYSDTVEATKD